jgi:hypothetical protein
MVVLSHVISHNPMDVLSHVISHNPMVVLSHVTSQTAYMYFPSLVPVTVR